MKAGQIRMNSVITCGAGRFGIVPEDCPGISRLVSRELSASGCPDGVGLMTSVVGQPYSNSDGNVLVVALTAVFSAYETSGKSPSHR